MEHKCRRAACGQKLCKVLYLGGTSDGDELYVYVILFAKVLLNPFRPVVVCGIPAFPSSLVNGNLKGNCLRESCRIIREISGCCRIAFCVGGCAVVRCRIICGSILARCRVFCLRCVCVVVSCCIVTAAAAGKSSCYHCQCQSGSGKFL